MNDMRAVIVPKSDQINADDLLAGPRTITITKVMIKPGIEQPVSIEFGHPDGKVYRPCKSMARVLVHCWGPDANEYIGRSMTLYNDPTVRWGGMEVGGIRLSHLTHIKGRQTMALTATKGNKKPFTVQLLAVQPAAAQEAPKAAAAALPWIEDVTETLGYITDPGKWVTAWCSFMKEAPTMDDVTALATLDFVEQSRERAPPAVVAKLDKAIADATERLAERNEPEVVG